MHLNLENNYDMPARQFNFSTYLQLAIILTHFANREALIYNAED